MFDDLSARELNALAVELQAQGRCHDALNAFLKAAQLYRAAGDAKGEGRCLNGAGACSKDIGEIDRARSYLEDALTLRIRTGDQLGEAITLTTLGPIYQTLGEPDEAQRALNAALHLTERLGAYERHGQVLFNLAQVAATAGRLAQAQRWYELARRAALDTGNDVEAAKCIGGLTSVAMRLGLKKEAFDYARQSLRESGEVGNARGVSCAYHALGSLFFSERELEKAEIALEKSIDIDIETGAPAEAAISKCLLADVLQAAGRGAEARRIEEEALASARDLQAPNAELRALETLSAIAAEEGDDRGALELCELSLAASRRAGDRMSEAWTLSHIALMDDRMGRRPEAFALLEQAAAILDEIRGSIFHDPHRLAFFAQRDVQSVYAIYVDLLLKESFATGDGTFAERAFAVRERSHTRALLDVLYVRGTTGPQRPDGSRSITLPEAQQLLDAETALIEYSVHKGVSYAFIVTRDDLRIVRLPSSSDIRHALAPEIGLVIQGDVPCCAVHRAACTPPYSSRSSRSSAAAAG